MFLLKINVYFHQSLGLSMFCRGPPMFFVPNTDPYMDTSFFCVSQVDYGKNPEIQKIDLWQTVTHESVKLYKTMHLNGIHCSEFLEFQNFERFKWIGIKLSMIVFHHFSLLTTKKIFSLSKICFQVYLIS